MYALMVLIHLLGLTFFLVAHGVSMFCAFRVRRETDRTTISSLLGLSVQGSHAANLGLIVLGISGLIAAAQFNWLLATWVVASYIVLAVVLVVMFAVAASFYYPLRAQIAGNDKTPQISDEELRSRLNNRRPELLAAVGGIGLVMLTWLMVYKPT